MSRDRYIRLSDFQTREIAGKTHGTADTQQFTKHGVGFVPTFWIILEGDVYIPAGGVGADKLDVRSRNTSESFRLLLFF